MICCSVRATEDNRASTGRRSAPTRASDVKLYGGRRSQTSRGVVQERKAAESGRRPAANAFASRRTLLLEGRHNKYVIYPPADQFDVFGLGCFYCQKGQKV